MERGSRTEQPVNLALAEMYVQGVCTRKVVEVLQKLAGSEVSVASTQISRCAEKLDIGLKAWRSAHPKLVAWAETNLAEGFAVPALPPEHRVRIRTTNGLERLDT